MNDTPEGMSGRKFSFLREPFQGDETKIVPNGGPIWLMQGAIPLASLTKTGDEIKFLLVTSPQLWSAANEVVYEAVKLVGYEKLNPQLKALAQMVAKAVGKAEWRGVLQS